MIILFRILLIFSVLLYNPLFAQDSKAANVIILIGDGMGFNSNLAGTYYRFGEAKKQVYDAFPVHLACTTFSRLKKDQPIPFEYKGYEPDVFWSSFSNVNLGTGFTRTTDSAAASTAIHSGTKTLNAHIGVGADGLPLELVSEIALKRGKKVGAVTTVQVSHATPGGFAAHTLSRDDMDDIFRQMTHIEKGLTVVMGAGHPLFDHGNPIEIGADEKHQTARYIAVGGPHIWERLSTGQYNGYTVIERKDQFADLADKKGTIPKKVIGIVRENIDLSPADGFIEDLPETRKALNQAYQNRNWNELPTLSEMSLAALNVLQKDNSDGFLLLIEGGAIDHMNHGQHALQSCMEHVGFSKAVEAVLDWLEKHQLAEETLVIVTSDHETGLIWGENSYNDASQNEEFGEGDGEGKFVPIKNNGRGKLPGMQYAGRGHSNALVPLWARGPGAELFLKRIKGTDQKAADFWNFSGNYIDNTDIAEVIKEVLAE